MFNGGGWGGYSPGYRDPLSGGGFGGFGVAMGGVPTSQSRSIPRNVGGALSDLVKKGGGAVDWLTDEGRGENRINALFGTASLLANLYGARQQGKRDDREDKRMLEERERERKRQEAADPYRQRILEILSNRVGS